MAYILCNTVGSATKIELNRDFYPNYMSIKLYWANIKIVDARALTNKSLRNDGRTDMSDRISSATYGQLS